MTAFSFMRHVFVSYSHDDADFAHILNDQLNQAGFSVWKDLDLRAGDTWHEEIEDAIRSALAVVLIASERAQASPYVNFEWAFAVGAGIPVLPLLLKTQADSLHPRLKSLQALDFSNYMLRPWDSLTQSLKALALVERPFTVLVPRDAPPFIQKAAQELDSIDAPERIAAVTLLAGIDDPAAREVLAAALRHPAADVRDIAAQALVEAKDLRAVPAILDAIRYKRFDRVGTNSLVELGEATVPTLVAILRDPSQGTHLRYCMASALGDMLNDQSLEALHELLQSPEQSLRVRALESLAGHPRALPWILEAAHDADADVTAAALKGLKHYQGADVVATLVDGLKHPGLAPRQAAADALVEVADATAGPALLQTLRDDDNYVRSRAREALTKVVDPSLIPALLQMLEETPYKSPVVDLLVQLKGDVVVNRMVELLQSPNSALRATAASALGHIGDRVALPALIAALKDEEEDVRKFSAFALGDLKDPAAVSELIPISRDADEFDEVRRAAALSLNQIGTREARIAYRDWERQVKNT